MRSATSKTHSWCYYCLLLACLAISTAPRQVSAQPVFFTAQKPDAFDALVDDSGDILIEHEDDAYWSWMPSDATKVKKVGFVYHPGCFYDERAYAPILRALAEDGYPAFLLDVPLSFSILTPFRADLVMREYPEIETWVVGGHGLGGMVASVFTQFRRNKWNIDGLALFASYPFPIFNNLSNTDIKAISLWGNEDGITTRVQWEDGKRLLPDDAKFVEIDGGNHSQMAYLSTLQTNDKKATISRESQQSVVQAELKALMAEIEAEI